MRLEVEYCNILINLSATVMHDAPDENFVSSGAEMSMTSTNFIRQSFFFSELVVSHFNFENNFFAI